MTWHTRYSQEEAERQRVASYNKEAALWKWTEIILTFSVILFFLITVLLCLGVSHA